MNLEATMMRKIFHLMTTMKFENPLDDNDDDGLDNEDDDQQEPRPLEVKVVRRKFFSASI